VRTGEVAVSIAQIKNAPDSTEALIEDQSSSKIWTRTVQRNKEWNEIVKARDEEQVALSQTFQMLISNGALELFKMLCRVRRPASSSLMSFLPA
jgi:hypothetical protein